MGKGSNAMANLTRRTIHLQSGEPIEVRRVRDGAYFCPVCGYPVSDNAPYEDTLSVDRGGNAVGPAFATPSYEKCESCNTRYGVTDVVTTGSLNDRWRELRLMWLDSAGWSKAALNQIREHLDISEDQLRRDAGIR